MSRVGASVRSGPFLTILILLRGVNLLLAVCHEYRRSIRRYATVREMKEDPSGSAIRC